MHIVVKILSGSDPNQNDLEVKNLGLKVALSDRVESVKAKIQKLEKSLHHSSSCYSLLDNNWKMEIHWSSMVLRTIPLSLLYLNQQV